MKEFCTLIMMAFCCNGWSQFSLSHQVIAFGTMAAENENAMSATVGEQVTGDLIGENTMLLQGFQQGHFAMVTAVEFPNAIALDIYPNPASDFITMELTGDPALIQFRLLNSLGQPCLRGVIQQGRKILDLRKIPRGAYWLHFIDGVSSRVQPILIH
ncbi:MAG: T9SS type A sorting domain-containing protein [Saprospiraceae bacterium]|nr:T9SS type A sorting domain-containing protein [Saprospiraceae bacterium]